MHSRKNSFQVQMFLFHSVVDAADSLTPRGPAKRRAFVCVCVFSYENKNDQEILPYLMHFSPL